MPTLLRTELPEFQALSPRLGCLVTVQEVVSKVVDDRFAFVPTRRSVDILNGVLARAQRKFPNVDVYGYYFLSNHVHWLLGTPDLVDASSFLEWTHREIARRINKLLDRTGPLFTRARFTQITTLEHAVQRLRYVMGQGTAQLIVRHPVDDVHACANRGLLLGERIVGTFRHEGGREERLAVRLDRLPGLGDLTPAEYRRLLWDLADDVAAEHRPRRKKRGLPVPDPEAARRIDPFSRPAERTRSPRPVVHGPPEHAERWHEAHAATREAYTAASRAFQRWHADRTQPMLPWPPHTLPPLFARRAAARDGPG